MKTISTVPINIYIYSCDLSIVKVILSYKLLVKYNT